ncbi:HAD-IIA family hydrolase [Bifidobacterium psychraerophilum]|jgi:HAD superfamily hydrolase (TIGR01450 family)|uniref:HAD-IIA family hydrolase n=1 Tax=Bifidobacterium psychraerophilum TaxID=218140 RepID=UPI0023F4F587|nr:HAD-IIA family hydrolase [Bifidobacterium psychraerophilum]MCI1661109.1 HAD-IIA family hydrolase [Bifidobacterium psychraerophilum]MCI1803966.1 HAD-IIA family hydrolase [Bifidobacterium psychraerophilum]MCI2175736.1 HAD-IIA family hydrolase [Bifidobacterium psychraerophilum]MCI2181742.1 HAD-IIA family hydrolase [Bifidobacterium psychraerophilum]
MSRYLLGTEGPLASGYSLSLLDLDGVVYRGKNPIEHAAQGIAASERLGMRASYTTNNPSRFPSTVAEQLRGFGLRLGDDQIITSAIVAARMLAGRLERGSKVLIVGAEHLRDEVRKAGFEVVDNADKHPDAVLQSWHADLTFNELAQAAYAIEGGAEYYVTNRDLTIPREQGIAPGNGALQLAVIAATGKEPVSSAGKPESAMYDEARVLFSRDEHIVPVAKSLPVGDRLDTDIEAANRGGYDSLVVLTGVADPRQIMLAPAIQRPTFIAYDLRGLNTVHPQPVRLDDGSWQCRGFRASLEGTVVRLRTLASVQDSNVQDSGVQQDSSSPVDGIDDGLDALRAACCAAWEAADSGIDPQSLTLPTDLLDS